MSLIAPHRLARRALVTSALTTLAMLATGCGSAAPIVSRDGNAWQCGQQLRKLPKSDALLGWVSISSVDRWIAAVDRIGQRARQFAPGSSVRDMALSTAEAQLAAMGVKDLSWLDLMRPIHLLIQADAKNPVFGVSAVVPVTDHGKVIEATTKLRTDFKADGHDLVLDLAKAGGKGTGRKPLWIRWLDHGTALAALNPDRIAAATTLAKCVETRQPRELLHVGVAVADLLSRHKPEFSALRYKLLGLAKMTGQNDAMLAYWSERIEHVLTETDAAMVMASAGKDDVSVGVSLHAKPQSELGTTWTRQAKIGPNPLAHTLPADAYLAVTQSYDAMASKHELEVMMKFYVAAMKVPEAEADQFRADLTEMLSLMGLHSAVAMYRDGRFPLGTYGVLQAKKPAKLLKVFGRVVLTSLRLTLKQMRTKLPSSAKTQSLMNTVEGAIGLGWGGMIQRLISKSQAWPVHFSHTQQAPKGMTCQVLRMTPDAATLANAPQRARMFIMFVPKSLDLAVCTGDDKLHVAMGPGALRRIGTAATGGGKSVADTAWYRTASQLGGKTAQMTIAVQPAPLVQIAQAFMPNLPEWPKGAAVSTACAYAPAQLRCDLRVPVVIADFVAAVRAQ